jgi:Family of unknown function (DUF6328)
MSDERHADGTRGAQPDESDKERVDRELGELLEEIRTILPGVQILFGFLVLLPFQFPTDLDDVERILYVAALLSVAGAFALLVAPSVHHRIHFRRLDKEALLFRASRMVIAASGLLAFATATTVYLALSTITGETLAGILAGVVAGWFLWFWYGLAFRTRDSDR